jgi:hypothetical protein
MNSVKVEVFPDPPPDATFGPKRGEEDKRTHGLSGNRLLEVRLKRHECARTALELAAPAED